MFWNDPEKKERENIVYVNVPVFLLLPECVGKQNNYFINIKKRLKMVIDVEGEQYRSTHTHTQHILESTNQPKRENDSLLKNLALSTLKKSFIMIKHVGVFDIYRYSNKTKYS